MNKFRLHLGWMVAAALWSALATGARGADAPPSEAVFARQANRLARDYFAKTGKADRTPLEVEALGTFFAAKEIYDAGRFAECRDRLDAFWKRRPMGKVEIWTNVDWPTGYVPLQMLTECVHARTSKDWFQGKPEPWRMTAVLIGKTVGSKEVTGDLLELGDSKIAEQEVQRATAFFGEYLKAITKGRLQLEVRVVSLNNWSPPQFKEGDSFVSAVEKALPPEIRRTTDCWWMMLSTTNPIIGFWGGTLVEDDGRQHFLGGSEWVQSNQFRKGPPSDQEYQTGVSNWFHHEFYHYLFHAFPEFNLEPVEHAWWYRDKWPADFVGYYETDYFLEGLHKRIHAKGDPPIHVRLKYKPPDAPAAPQPAR
ncbi:MAG: hypothetical protein K8T91_12480 [Planctomycetes bacterium]|nr:hypothetical protein [Planctomycetota bacterium]